jgi:hypothetical protein
MFQDIGANNGIKRGKKFSRGFLLYIPDENPLQVGMILILLFNDLKVVSVHIGDYDLSPTK